MVYRGQVRNGVIVLEGDAQLEEGTRVSVVASVKSDASVDEEPDPLDEAGSAVPTLYERLRPVIGAAKGLPPDASEQVDHYLYGTPKR